METAFEVMKALGVLAAVCAVLYWLLAVALWRT